MQKNKHKRTISFANGFFILSLSLATQASATWKCKLSLTNGSLVIEGVSALETDAWIPEGAVLAEFKVFKAALPKELQNSRELSDLIEASPTLKQAFSIYINSLDSNPASQQEPSSSMVSNSLSRILFNEGNARTQGADEIAKFLREMQMRSLAAYKPEELPLLSPERRIKLWAAEIEKELHRRWYDKSDDETVYNWILADNLPEIKEKLWGATQDLSDFAIVGNVGHLPSIQKLLKAQREAPLFKKGEILRDNFRIALETFETEQLKTLKEKYDLMFFLKDKGAMDDVSMLLEPFLKPRDDADYQDHGYAKEHRDVITRLFNSAHFFEAFTDFQEAYLVAGNALLELSKNPKLTQLERRKLSDIAQEKLITYSIDLISIGLNYHPPHEYRY